MLYCTIITLHYRLALIYGILSPEVDVISVTLPNHDTLETVKSALALLDVHQVTGSNETPQRHSGRRSFKGNGTVISVATNTAAPTDVPPETLLLQHNLKL